jgi:hypothetical protein
MGVFDDKKFENLDWISQATEPIDSELNEILASIPDEVVIDFKMYKSMASNHSLDLSIDSIVTYCISKFSGKAIHWNQRQVITECFQLQMDESVILDFEKRQIIGDIKIVKIQTTMDEKVLEGLLGREGIEFASYMNIPRDGMTRANDVMELLGKCEQGLKSRSERKKKIAIKNRLTTIFKTNEWKIKDTELANKVGKWIKDYVVDGNLASWSNFCRLKVMTHKDQPIYSMEEAK